MGCQAVDYCFLQAFNHDEDTRPHFRILSLDGGGVKGIMPALQLEQLELELQAEVSRWQSGAEWRGEALEKMRKSVAAEVGREDLPSIGDAPRSGTPFRGTSSVRTASQKDRGMVCRWRRETATHR